MTTTTKIKPKDEIIAIIKDEYKSTSKIPMKSKQDEFDWQELD